MSPLSRSFGSLFFRITRNVSPGSRERELPGKLAVRILQTKLTKTEKKILRINTELAITSIQVRKEIVV